MTKKQKEREQWEKECYKYGLDDLAKSIRHWNECPKHDLYHLTKEALAYHKHIIH